MIKLFRRITGGLIVLVGLVGLAAGIYGAYRLLEAADRLEQKIVDGMDFGLEGLETV